MKLLFSLGARIRVLFFVMSLVCVSFALAGCDECENVANTITQLDVLRARVTLTSLDTSTLARFCAEYSKTYDKQVIEATRLARRISQEVFSQETDRCGPHDKRHFRRVCEPDDLGRVPMHSCETKAFCMRRTDGYFETVEFFDHLANFRNEVIAACMAQEQNNMTRANDYIFRAKGTMESALQNATTAYTKAGCQQRRGN